MKIAGELKHSFVNGPGVRYVVFFQGCPHNCPGCHNPETHDLAGGTECAPQEVIARIADAKFLDGVTLSGGDPFLQPKACAEIAQAAKAMELNVWAYTGWWFEDLMKSQREALRDIDVLVDGPFDEALKSESCLWRGSTNQRLVNVQASLQKGETVLLEGETIQKLI